MKTKRFNKAHFSRAANLHLCITTADWLYERIVEAINDCENAVKDKDYEWGTFLRDENGECIKDNAGKYQIVKGGEVSSWVLEVSSFSSVADYDDIHDFFGDYGWFEDEDEETLDKIDLERCWHDGVKFRSFTDFVDLIQHVGVIEEYIDFEYDYINLHIDFQHFTADIKRQMAIEKILD